MENGESGQNGASVWISWRWPAVVIMLALISLVAFLVFVKAFYRTIEKTSAASATAVTSAASAAVRAAEKFQKGTITTTFTAAIPTLNHGRGGILELASASTTETFSRTDSKTAMWDWVYLGTTVTEIKVPVTYRYHLLLSDPWKLDVMGSVCIVHCPSFKPSLPPAIHTDRMEKRAERGWARFNASEQMTELEKSITPTLNRYAANEKHMNLVREECRKTVAEFVRGWLLKEDQWRNDRFHAIKVIFADEAATNIELAPPVLQLN
jgi:hypothetical protein